MSKCWYCNNELTSGDNPKHFGICNKCYDEMFKSGDTIIRSLMDKIAELQKQLKSQPKEIIEKIKKQLIKRLNTIAGYGRMTIDGLSFFIETEFDSDLDDILKEYQKEK